MLFRIRGAQIARNVTMNDARNEIVCSSNLRHLSRSDIILLLSPRSRFVSPSVKELIRINRCSLYALSSLSRCQKRSFSWLIMIRWAASHRLHANFVIRHVYNQLIINHTWSFISDAAHRILEKSVIHSRSIDKKRHRTHNMNILIKYTFERKSLDIVCSINCESLITEASRFYTSNIQVILNKPLTRLVASTLIFIHK